MHANSDGDARKRTGTLAVLFLVALLTTACSSGEGGDPGGDGGQPGASDGTLIISSRTDVRSYDLTGNADLLAQLPTGGSTHPALHPGDGHLYMASFIDPLDSITVQRYDPEDLVPIGSPIEWPETVPASGMSGLAFSPDSQLAAAIINEAGFSFLQVVDMSTDEPVQLLRGFRNVTGDSLVWLNNDALAFVMDVSDVDEPEVAGYAGAIVSIEPRVAAGDPNAGLAVIAGFTGDNWHLPNRVRDLAVNEAGDELLYSFDGNLYVKEAPFDIAVGAPHQLTSSGSNPHVGAVFSPDGQDVAFVDYAEGYQSDVFVIPNHRSAPIEPTDSHLVLRTNVQRLVGWLP